jgi:serine/threonine-protein kinase
MTVSAASLVDTIRRCRLLEPARLNELASDLLPQLPDSQLLARELLERAWLTPFQINQLLRGHGSQLCFGPYVILDRLGKGGMGRVYKARRQDQGPPIALKILRKRFSSHPLALERFRREAQAVAQLSHPNIVPAHEAGHVGDTPFLAMEYVAGIDLAQLVEKRGPLPIAEACTYGYQAALGLQHAHERGIIHRDIKPRNLLIARPTGGRQLPEVGQVRILDFGLALLESEAVQTNRLTKLGRRVGTVEYMAPEQEVSCRDADTRSDVYSLGCSVYYALAGRPPFLESDPSLRAYPQVSWEAPPIKCFRADVPPALGAVLAKMLVRVPAGRFQTADEVAAALRPFCPMPTVEVMETPRVASLPGPVSQECTTSAPGATEMAVEPSRITSYLLARRRRKLRRLVLGLAGGLLLFGAVLLLVLRPPTSHKNAGPADGDHSGKTGATPKTGEVNENAPRDDVQEKPRAPRFKKEEEEDEPGPVNKGDKKKPLKEKKEEEEEAP